MSIVLNGECGVFKGEYIAIDAKSNIVPEIHMNKATAKDDRGMHR